MSSQLSFFLNQFQLKLSRFYFCGLNQNTLLIIHKEVPGVDYRQQTQGKQGTEAWISDYIRDKE